MEAHNSNDQSSRGRRNEVIGRVIADKMAKTVTVIVYRKVKHKQYGKYIRRSTVLKAHDEGNIARVGDKVCIHETRPLSKTKRWMLNEVIEKVNK